jgi:hypothetical protein
LICARLYDLGWRPSARVGVHKPADASKVYMASKAFTRKFYYQCLLMLPELWSLGLTELAVSQPQSYYKLLLKRQLVLPGLGDAEYQRLLRGQPRRLAIQDDASSDHIVQPLEDAEEAFALEDMPAAAEVVVAAEPQAHEQSSGAAASSSNVTPPCPEAAQVPMRTDSVSDEDIVQGPGLLDDPRIPAYVEGVRLGKEVHVQAGANYRRFIVACPCPNDHPGKNRCGRKRNAMVNQTCTFGILEPVAFLACWVRASPRCATRAAHQAYMPSLQEQEAWLREQGFL